MRQRKLWHRHGRRGFVSAGTISISLIWVPVRHGRSLRTSGFPDSGSGPAMDHPVYEVRVPASVFSPRATRCRRRIRGTGPASSGRARPTGTLAVVAQGCVRQAPEGRTRLGAQPTKPDPSRRWAAAGRLAGCPPGVLQVRDPRDTEAENGDGNPGFRCRRAHGHGRNRCMEPRPASLRLVALAEVREARTGRIDGLKATWEAPDPFAGRWGAARLRSRCSWMWRGPAPPQQAVCFGRTDTIKITEYSLVVH